MIAVPAPADIHPQECDCHACTPYHPADEIAPRWRASAGVIAALAVGQMIVIALDAAVGGPGPFVVFGL